MHTKKRLVIPVLLVAMLGLLACSKKASGVEGTYQNSDWGTIVIDADGKGNVRQEGSNEDVPITYTRDGDKLTLTAEGESIDATVKDDQLVFAAGTIEEDKQTVFSKK